MDTDKAENISRELARIFTNEKIISHGLARMDTDKTGIFSREWTRIFTNEKHIGRR